MGPQKRESPLAENEEREEGPISGRKSGDISVMTPEGNGDVRVELRGEMRGEHLSLGGREDPRRKGRLGRRGRGAQRTRKKSRVMEHHGDRGNRVG